MSGGIAYVLDEDGGFASRCNAAMVELAPLDDEDESTVRALVEEHVRRTDSVKGKSVLAGLASGDRAQAPFVKVLPLEYKRVLELRRKANVANENNGAARTAATATPKAAG
jgi:glutamate synthase domain-containing protein 3